QLGTDPVPRAAAASTGERAQFHRGTAGGDQHGRHDVVLGRQLDLDVTAHLDQQRAQVQVLVGRVDRALRDVEGAVGARARDVDTHRYGGSGSGFGRSGLL